MAAEIGSVFYRLEFDTTAFNAAADAVSKKLKGVGDHMKAVGTNLSLKLTAPIVGFGTAALLSATSYQDAMARIARSTGATGDELKEFESVFLSLSKTVPASMGDIEAVINGVNGQLGLTGEALEKTSKNFLDFARINAADPTTTTAKLTKVITNLGLSAEEIPGFLDKLTFASIETGAGVDALGENIIRTLPQFSAMGLGIDEQIALLSNFEKFGINGAKAMMGLTGRIAELAKKGITGSDALNKLLDPIKNAKTDAEALDQATTIFGDNVGIKLVKQIKDGVFNIKDLSEGIKNSGGTLNTTAENTKTFSESMLTLKNNLSLALVPIGEDLIPIITKVGDALKGVAQWFGNLSPGIRTAIIVIGGFLAALGPILLILGTVAGAIGSIVAILPVLAGAFAVILSPISLIVIAVIGLTILIVKNWDKIKAAITAGVAWLGSALSGAWENIKLGASLVWKFIVTSIKTFIDNVGNGFLVIKEAIIKPFRDAFDWIKNAVTSVWEALQKLNPFARHSPSLIDQITQGMAVIKKQYGGLTDIQFPGLTPNVALSAAEDGGSARVIKQEITVNVDRMGDGMDLTSVGRELGFRVGLMPEV